MMMKLLPLFFLSLLFCCVLCRALNTRPILGIITEDVDWKTNYGSQYIAASYVKFIESGGARVVPVRYTMTQSELVTLLGHLNGFLFPGGDSSLAPSSQYYKSLETIFNYTIKANQNGDYFPLWGTCLGFEELHVLAAGGDRTVLSPVVASNFSIPLDFTVDPLTQSRLFASATPDIVRTLGTANVTLNNHVNGVLPSTYKERQELRDFFDVISTDQDKNGVVFISTVEAKNYPIYGAQWHAEKPLFEWNPTEAINHTTDSVRANQYTADFLVSEARKSNHHFPSFEEESNYLIYQFQPYYTWPEVNDFEQCYFFD